MLPTIATGNVGSALAGGYEVANSLRFDGSNDYLNITSGSSPTNTKKFTVSFWLKRSELGREQHIFGGVSAAQCYFISDDRLRFADTTSGTNYYTTQKFRDVSAWYHIVIAVDTTLGTAGDRARIYVNGSEITAFDTETNATQNNNTAYNIGSTTYVIGRYNPSQAQNYYYSGYMAEYVFIDGQQLDPTSFGEFDEDSGIWKPIDVSGLTFGNNGFYLDFENSGSLGADVSGNGNNFTVNNLTSVDQSTDTCTNNFATSNPLIDSGTGYSQGNLDLSFGNASQDNAGGTFGVSKGKWYWEHKIISSGNTHYLGIKSADSDLTSTSGASGTPSMYYTNGGKKVYNASSGGSAYGNTFSNNDIIGIALDLDNNAIWFSKNGTWQNSATQSEIEAGTTTNAAFSGTGSSDGFPSEQVYLPWIVGQTGGAAFTMTTNFGSPSFSISSGNSDGNGYGNFEYSVPSGYYALNTKNLAEYG